jgi:inorganic pyrophosphatase
MDNVLSSLKAYHVGTLGHSDYRVYLCDGNSGDKKSFFNDIPLYYDKENDIVNMVVEIPKDTRYKLEISMDDKHNPIKHDLESDNDSDSEDSVRVIRKKYPFNYGALPQTWENPDKITAETGTYGDNDPLDICEISDRFFETGSIVPVKVLGVYAMIDAGQTDWKVVCINVGDYDKNADLVDRYKMVFDFLQTYKGHINKFAFDNKFLDVSFANRVIDETNQEYLVYKMKN